MNVSKIRNSVERWLIHEGLSFEETKNTKNSFHILVKHTGRYGNPVEIFEPKTQIGILVVGAKVIMKNSQIARYLGFNEREREIFEKKVSDFCNSIQAINKIITEDGKQKIGVYVVLDDKENINQQTVFDAIDKVSEIHDRTSRYLMKTF